jgi:hypothetical protein
MLKKCDKKIIRVKGRLDPISFGFALQVAAPFGHSRLRPALPFAPALQTFPHGNALAFE